MAEVALKDLLEAGAHFGHQTRRWNPKMAPYIFGVRAGVHIIDLTKTSEGLKAALEFVRRVTAAGGQVLFVGTKRQAKGIVARQAQDAGQPYVTERWLGGMLTNFRTIRLQTARLKKLEGQLESGELASKFNKKEMADLADEAKALERSFGGIKTMENLPVALYVVDVPREHIAVAEALKLGIPVVGIADSNADPDQLDYPIPGNDDAIKSIQLITEAVAQAAAEGRTKHAAIKTAADAETDVKESAKEGGDDDRSQ